MRGMREAVTSKGNEMGKRGILKLIKVSEQISKGG